MTEVYNVNKVEETCIFHYWNNQVRKILIDALDINEYYVFLRYYISIIIYHYHYAWAVVIVNSLVYLHVSKCITTCVPGRIRTQVI